MSDTTEVTNDELNESEISGENAEVYLFQWLSGTEKKLGTSTTVKSQQASLEKTLLKCIAGDEPFPAPGRAIRGLVGRIMVLLYRKGETRTMFDTLQALLALIKGDGKEAVKIAAYACIGDLMAVFGANVMSLMAEICTLALKTARSSVTTLLRYHALRALARALGPAKRAVVDSMGRDILKAARNCLSDKAFGVQRGAAEVLIAMYTEPDAVSLTLSELDGVVSTSIKSISQESIDQVTTASHARLVGTLLSLSQVARALPSEPPKATKEKKKDGALDGDDDANDTTGGAGSAAEAATMKALLTPQEMLIRLSLHWGHGHVQKGTQLGQAGRKLRTGLTACYAVLFSQLGAGWVETNFAVVFAHLMSEIVSPPAQAGSSFARYQAGPSAIPVGPARYDVLLSRGLVGAVLRDLVGVRLLSEQAQIGAIQEIASSYLRRWPALLGVGVGRGNTQPTEPAPEVLVVALREVAGLVEQLGNAPPPVQSALQEPLVALLAHPSHSVRVNAAWALRCFCYSTPLRLPKTILTVMDKLQRDLSAILVPASAFGTASLGTGPTPQDIPARAMGHAYGLAALVSTIPQRPLYASYDASAKVLDMATSLLKAAGAHDLRPARVEVAAAWTLIAALTSLGPNFVRPHLPQLLVLWRNALPKPTSKDAQGNAGRARAEWAFLLDVREAALGAVLGFLRANRELVTLDVARRVSSLLGNALSFANNFISAGVLDDPAMVDGGIPGQPQSTGSAPGAKSNELSLREKEALLRRRVHQCFVALGFGAIPEATQVVLLQSAVGLFAGPEGYAGSAVQAAIASNTGTFTNVWAGTDGYAYGVTGEEVVDLGGTGSGNGDGGHGSGGDGMDKGDGEREGDYLNRDEVEVKIDIFNRKPILRAVEHDPLAICQAKVSDTDYRLYEAPPPATAVVDTAIDLFARLLPLQDLQTTAKIIGTLLENVRSPKLERNAGRKAAIHVNAVVALVRALRVATTSHFRQARDTFGSSQITGMLSPFLMDAIVDGDLVLRSAGSESIGRLASLSGTNYLTSQIKDLVDQVVSNRNPNGRAGCALSFGAIYSHVGGLAAGPLLKTTVNVLMSLINDPHPVVHFWALNALARVINAASLAYAPFVPSTLGMLLKVYLTEAHEREGGTLANSNTSGDLPAYPIVCQIIDSVITVLGPDIQESARTRALVQSLMHEFSVEEDEGICVEAIKCIQHFLMFAPEHADTPNLVKRFRAHLASSRRPLKLASINAIYQLVQKDALSMSKLGGDQLVEDLFGMLDDDSSVQGVRNVISSWLQQTVIYNPSAWIDLCQRIMARTTASQQVADAASRQNMQRDDEGESLNVGLSQDGSKGGRGRVTVSRWRTQLFALQCLHEICVIVVSSGRKEHLNAIVARSQGIPAAGMLFSRVSDLIKMAFTASTAYVTEIRLAGLVVLRDVIEMFAQSPDPAYDDALLLEQHQAPITAAVTPAFSSDSTPEILASAIHACAVFVGCGVVKDVGRMGRSLKLLISALEQSKDAGMLSLGDAGELSPNASAMLRISTLSAWAQLQVSSVQQTYLENVVKPYRSTLCTLWIAALRDYASIRIDSEFLHDTSSVVDSSYSSLGKEVLLPYYSQSWSVILQAVATTMEAGNPHILAAMDGTEYDEKKPKDLISNLGTGRKEPTAFFFVIFGLVYEALATSSADSTSTSSSRQATALSALHALKWLVRPDYSGNAILEPTIFDEFISLCYRIGLTETPAIQIRLVQMLTVWAQSSPVNSEDVLSLTGPSSHCLRICANVLKQTLSVSRGSATPSQLADRIALISSCISAYAVIASSVTSAQREDIRGVGIVLYSELLKDESSEIDLVSPTLTALKGLLDVPVTRTNPTEQGRYSSVIHALLSACLLNIDSMRGRSGAISTKKIKNNMLAAVLVLTIIPSWVKVGRSVVEHACYLISQKLADSDQTSLTASHCAKTLVLASVSGSNPILRHCARLLIPGLIEFVAKLAPLVHDGSVDEGQAAALGEVWKAFGALFGAATDENSNRSRLLGVFLPTIALLLSSSSPTSPSPAATITSSTVSQLLSFATTSPAAFKEALEKLDVGTKELLEQAIRKAVGGGGKVQGQSLNIKPQISLRSF